MATMPDPAVPLNRMDPRHSPDADRASCMVDVDFGPETLAEEKLEDPYCQIGTASDYAGITTEANKQGMRRPQAAIEAD